MQQLTLHPGLLTFRVGTSGTAEHPVVYDEQHTAIHLGRLVVRLSPLEYSLVMALLRQRERSQTAHSPSVSLCITAKRLRTLSGSKSEQSIHHALNDAKQKIEGLGIHVIRFHDRYFVL